MSVAIVIVFPVLLLVFLVAMQRLDTFVDAAGPAKAGPVAATPAAVRPAPVNALPAARPAVTVAPVAEDRDDRLSA